MARTEKPRINQLSQSPRRSGKSKADESGKSAARQGDTRSAPQPAKEHGKRRSNH